MFPLADSTDDQLSQWRRQQDASKFKQTIECAPGLVVTPAKGKAILWYNHKVRKGEAGAICSCPARLTEGTWAS